MKKLFMLMLLALTLVSCGGSSEEQTPEQKVDTANSKITELNSMYSELNNMGVDLNRYSPKYTGSTEVSHMKDVKNKLTLYIVRANEVLALASDDDVFFMDSYKVERYKSKAMQYQTIIDSKIQTEEVRIARARRDQEDRATFDQLEYSLTKAGFSINEKKTLHYSSDNYEQGLEVLKNFVKKAKQLNGLTWSQESKIDLLENYAKNKANMAVAYISFQLKIYKEFDNQDNFNNEAEYIKAMANRVQKINTTAMNALILFGEYRGIFQNAFTSTFSMLENFKANYLELTGEELKIESEPSEDDLEKAEVA